jgi:chromate transporter
MILAEEKSVQETADKARVKPTLSVLVSLFLIFLRIGAFTWGGGYCMLPLIKCEVVDKRRWLTSEAFLDGVAVAQSLPGALAVNSATFVGNRVAGTAGAIVAALGAVLPSYIALILVSAFFLSFRELAPVQNFFKGAVPAVAVLLVNAVIDMGKEALKHYSEVIIAAALLVLLVVFHLHPIAVILLAGTLGLFRGERK